MSRLLGLWLCVCVALATSSVTAVSDPDWSGLDWVGGFGQLRATFELESGAGSSMLYATSLGCHQVYVNGAQLGPGILDPGFSTVPHHRLLYITHNITSVLRQGKNTVGVRLGACKYGWMHTYCAEGAAKCLGLKLQVIQEGKRILGTTGKGSEWAWTGTASPWLPDAAAYPFRALWDGARYNYSIEQPGWATTADSTGQKSSLWSPALVIRPPIDPPELSPSPIPPITKHPEGGIAPVEIWSPEPGIYVADFGTNIAGYATIRLPESAGAKDDQFFTISALHGEILYKPMGRVQNQYAVPPHKAADCEHYGSCALQTDIYTDLPAQRPQDMVLEPLFTYHGFRYVEVNASGPGAPRKVTRDMLTAYFLYTDVKSTGRFNSKSPVLNGIYAAALRSELGNLHSLPTDCPTREKRGWMGDAQWSAEANVVSFDIASVYENYVRTIGDTQVGGCTHGSSSDPPPDYCLNNPISAREALIGTPSRGESSVPPCYLCCDAAVTNRQRFGCYSTDGAANQSFANVSGSVPGVVPFDVVAGWPADPAWGAASVVIPYAVWKQTGSRSAAANTYPTVRRYIEFLLAHTSPDGLVRFGMLGDWNSLTSASGPAAARLQAGRTPVPQVSAFYGALCVGMASKMASAIGLSAEAAHYAAVEANMKSAYHEAFYRPDHGTYAPAGDAGLCSQTSNVLPIVLGVVPDAEIPRVWAALNASLHCAGPNSSSPAITAGCAGTRYIFEALVRLGREDVALEIANSETMPSFGYMVAQGPGTLWEEWAGTAFAPGNGVSSKNHHMYGGGVTLFLYQSVAGLRHELRHGSKRVVVVKPLLRIMERVINAAATMRAPAADGSGRSPFDVQVSWNFAPANWTVRVLVSRPELRKPFMTVEEPDLEVRVPLGSGHDKDWCAQSVSVDGLGKRGVLWARNNGTANSWGAAMDTIDEAGRHELIIKLPVPRNESAEVRFTAHATLGC